MVSDRLRALSGASSADQRMESEVVSATTSPARLVVSACVIVPSDDVPQPERVAAVVSDALREYGWLVKYCDADVVEDET